MREVRRRKMAVIRNVLGREGREKVWNGWGAIEGGRREKERKIKDGTREE